MRLFVAVNFDDIVRGAIRDAIDDFPIANPPWRWAAPETWHVTLKFIGQRHVDELPALLTALDAVRARHRSFYVAFRNFGAFPSLHSPRVLFYDLQSGRAEMAALAADVDEALHDAVALERETRDFHAHATVARLKERLPSTIIDQLSLVPALSHPASRVSSFELMESRLGRTGAHYSVVKKFALP